MRPEWLWDRNIPMEEIQNSLKDPHSGRFVEIAALLLSRRNTPKEVFDRYLDKTLFVQHWARIKRRMRQNAWNDQRIVFWQAVYAKIVSEFKEKGVTIRPTKEEKEAGESWQIAEKVKAFRKEMGLTQNALAKRLGISQQIISRVETGHDNMRFSTLARIFNSFGQQLSIELRLMWTPDQICRGDKNIHA